MQTLRTVLLVGTLAATVLAQNTHVLPDGFAAAEGNGLNGIPWNYPSARVQFAYDSSHFTGAATPITQPILIQRLRWRANGSATATWTGGSYGQVRIDLSTAAVDHAAVVPTFAQNHGQDRTTVHNGPVTVSPQPTGFGVPGPWFVDVPLAQPFFYDPNAGDLLIDIDTLGTFAGGTSTLLDHVQGGLARASRVAATLTYGGAQGGVTLDEAAVVEVTYVAASGLYPRFTATPQAGTSPLLVQFTDQSWTSDPGGVLAHQWDFDNDGIIDSTLRNPSHTYSACGTYSVRLLVVDATHGFQTLVRPAAVVVDAIAAGFTANVLAGVAPLFVQFTDTSSGPVTTWAWDFNGDNVADSTLQHPQWPFATAGVHTVALTVGNGCFSDTRIRQGYVVVIDPANLPPPPDLLQYQFNEVRGQELANTAIAAAFPARGTVGTPHWQADPGRAAFRGNEPGAGMLGSSNGVGATNLVDTGGSLTVSGSMTVMWWQRQTGLRSGTAYACGSSSGAGPRMYMQSSGILTYRGSSIGNCDSTSTPNSGANLGVWLHVAMVVDDAAGTATWHFNGIADPPRAFTANSHSAALTNFHIGYGSSATTGVSSYPPWFDMDDFRIYGRALSAGEIQAAIILAETPSAGRFGGSCPGPGGTPSIGTTGVPVLGTPGFGITLAGAEDNRLCAMVLGLTPRAFGTFDLSGLLGPGCRLEVDWYLALFYFTVGGSALHTMPIPNNQVLRGQHLYAQWLVAGSTGAATQALDLNIR